jgi:hypothetical protein
MISSTCVLSLFPKLQLFFSEHRIFDRQNMHFLDLVIACSSFGIERSEIHEEKLRISHTLGIKWSVEGRDLHRDRGDTQRISRSPFVCSSCSLVSRNTNLKYSLSRSP